MAGEWCVIKIMYSFSVASQVVTILRVRSRNCLLHAIQTIRSDLHTCPGEPGVRGADRWLDFMVGVVIPLNRDFVELFPEVCVLTRRPGNGNT